MAENVHMYQEEPVEENVNMRQEAKPITPKDLADREAKGEDGTLIRID